MKTALSALITTTTSPMSCLGCQSTRSLPCSAVATTADARPTTCTDAERIGWTLVCMAAAVRSGDTHGRAQQLSVDGVQRRKRLKGTVVCHHGEMAGKPAN